MSDAEGKSAGTSSRSQIEGEQLRRVLGHFATGVTVVTAHTEEGPVGMVANSFTSVSLDPPLVLFCAGTGSDTWPSIQKVGHFCINVLNHQQEQLAVKFAKKGSDRYEGVEHMLSAHGIPRLAGATAQIDCQIVAEHEAGDHVIVVGQVLEMDLADSESGELSAPLIFYRGGFVRLS
jgi:3-hydroxy-9,10-secoandrosta-1,3,5(10)-triene-9,17-dione monooxygenase reductase component